VASSDMVTGVRIECLNVFRKDPAISKSVRPPRGVVLADIATVFH